MTDPLFVLWRVEKETSSQRREQFGNGIERYSDIDCTQSPRRNLAGVVVENDIGTREADIGRDEEAVGENAYRVEAAERVDIVFQHKRRSDDFEQTRLRAGDENVGESNVSRLIAREVEHQEGRGERIVCPTGERRERALDDRKPSGKMDERQAERTRKDHDRIGDERDRTDPAERIGIGTLRIVGKKAERLIDGQIVARESARNDGVLHGSNVDIANRHRPLHRSRSDGEESGYIVDGHSGAGTLEATRDGLEIERHRKIGNVAGAEIVPGRT